MSEKLLFLLVLQVTKIELMQSVLYVIFMVSVNIMRSYLERF